MQTTGIVGLVERELCDRLMRSHRGRSAETLPSTEADPCGCTARIRPRWEGGLPFQPTRARLRSPIGVTAPFYGVVRSGRRGLEARVDDASISVSFEHESQG